MQLIYWLNDCSVAYDSSSSWIVLAALESTLPMLLEYFRKVDIAKKYGFAILFAFFFKKEINHTCMFSDSIPTMLINTTWLYSFHYSTQLIVLSLCFHIFIFYCILWVDYSRYSFFKCFVFMFVFLYFIIANRIKSRNRKTVWISIKNEWLSSNENEKEEN